MSDKETITQLVQLSKWAGERFDLVQAGGGNSSIKSADGMLHIKASGFALSEVEEDDGFVSLSNEAVCAIFDHPTVASAGDKKGREQAAEQLMQQAVAGQLRRPSIEVYLHAVLSKVTLHTHAVLVNAITCRKDWDRILTKLFPEALLVGYTTPGIDLALALRSALRQYQKQHDRAPRCIFLQNHGLIVSDNSIDAVCTHTDEITRRIETELGVDHAVYRLTNVLSHTMHSVTGDHSFISYRSEDRELVAIMQQQPELLSCTPFSPDGFVFFGAHPVRLKSPNDSASIKEYIEQYQEPPRVIVLQNELFCIAKNVKKAQEIESVLKFHLMALKLAGDSPQFLPEEELRYLGNWDAEKYRRALKK